MSNLTLFNTTPTTMSSREIAELTNKRHDHVLRDIDNLLETLSPDLGNGFKSSTYTTGVPPREYRMFVMDRDSSYCLMAGYDANARMRIIKRWQELETQPTQTEKLKLTPGEQAVRIAQETMRVGTALGMPLAHTQRLAFQRIADETGIHYTLPPIEKTPPATKKPSSSHPYIQPIANYLAQRNGATVTVSEVKTALNLPIHNTAIGRILSGLGRTIHIACVNGRTTRFWN